MAANRPTTARRNMNSARNPRGVYIDGSAARKLQEVPERRYYPPAQRPARQPAKVAASPRTQERQRTLSKEAKKNRAKAMSMNRKFVVFIAVVSTAVLFCCINYLRLKSDYTRKISQVASLESELAQLKEDNDAYYSEVTSNVDLDKIKKIAVGRLGMKNPSDDQVMTYSVEGGSYVRQYQDVP